MNSRLLYGFFIYGMFLLSSACSDADKEKELVDLFTTASKDLVAINFPSATTEDLISIDTFVDYRIEGVRSNGVDIVPVNDDIIWSLSDGAVTNPNDDYATHSRSVRLRGKASKRHCSHLQQVWITTSMRAHASAYL